MLLDVLPKQVREYVEEKARLMQPNDVYVCDGSEMEYNKFIEHMIKHDGLIKLKKLKNCFLALTDPHDVARVESKTVISSERQIDTIPTPRHGFTSEHENDYLPKMKMSKLGNWMSHEDLDEELMKRLPGCMRGRTMYVVPFSMGPIGGPISKIGMQLTDSMYVVCSMRIMTRMGLNVIKEMHTSGDCVKCVHSVGVPLPTQEKIINNWPCNPKMTIISHIPKRNEIISYGSGYGGNSLLGKKCFALRLGSILAKKEGWLAEHMLIVGVTNPQGIKKYIAAAFPSQCGKTNLAMMTPSLPGWKVECVGDDIAWMKFDSNGILRAINPENGFFGVCPGTNMRTNPNAMRTIQSNTIFTNVGRTSDGDAFWEDKDVDDYLASNVLSWKNEVWTSDSREPAAHPNSRFCTPASQCPIIDPLWESPEGVPISAILFGGRRPTGVPLVYEAFDWAHGVTIAASMRSEVTSAAEYTGKTLMHDPFGMRPFFGYNFGDYCAHWLDMERPERKMPKIFHVNWFRKSLNGKGKFVWPGFGDNIRVLDWIFRRCDKVNEIAQETPIGYVPRLDSLHLEGLSIPPEDLDELMSIPSNFWLQEVIENKEFFEENVNVSMPEVIYEQLSQIEIRLKAKIKS